MMTQKALFDAVASCSGLASWIGPGTVQRALSSVGVSSFSNAVAADYQRAMPQLRARMAMYLPPAELELRCRQLEALLSDVSAAGAPQPR